MFKLISKYYKLKMGPCFSQKAILDSNSPGEFYKDLPIKEEILKPLKTTLYNILRKPRQLQIIRESQGEIILQGQSNPDLSKIKTNDIKMLYNFKNVLIIDEIPNSLQNLRELVNLKAVYQISRKEAENFVHEYPIFQQKKQIKTSLIPLLVFHTDELRNSGSHSEKHLFLHSKKFKNQKIYSMLKINDIVEEGIDQKTGKPIDVVQKLKNSEGKNLLFLHSDGQSQMQILNTLANFVHQKYSTSIIQSKIYIRRFLPNTNLSSQLDPIISHSIIELEKQKEKQNEDSLSEKFYKYFKKFGDEAGKDKIERAYNLLVTLISNIYSNKQSDSYRKVKKTNKQINDVLGKYKYGVKLLEAVGFLSQGGFFSNNIQGKYLKLYRTDMDLGYRKLNENI